MAGGAMSPVAGERGAAPSGGRIMITMYTKTARNRRSLLAAAAVALLALVAVAGFAACSADDSAADSTMSYSYLEGSITVSQDTAATNFFIYGEDESTFTIPADVAYNGTLAFGYHRVVNGTTYDVILAQASFTDQKGLVIYYDGLDDHYFEVSATTKDTVLNMTLLVGKVNFNDGVTGTLVCPDRCSLTLDNVDELSVYERFEKVLLSDEYDGITGTVTLNGTAYSDDLDIDDGGNFVVAAGAVLNVSAYEYYDNSFTVNYKADGELTDANVKFVNDFYFDVSDFTATSFKVNTGSSVYANDTMIITMPGYVTNGSVAPVETLAYDIYVVCGKAYVIPLFAPVCDGTVTTSKVATATLGDLTAYTFRFSTGIVEYDLSDGELEYDAYDSSKTSAVSLYTEDGAPLYDSGDTTADNTVAADVNKGVVSFTLCAKDVFGNATSGTKTIYAALQYDYGSGYETLVYALSIKLTDAVLSIASVRQVDSFTSIGVIADSVIDEGGEYYTLEVWDGGRLTIQGTVNVTYDVLEDATGTSIWHDFEESTISSYSGSVIDVSAGTLNIDQDTNSHDAGNLEGTLNAAYYASAKKTISAVSPAVEYYTLTYTGLTAALAGAPAIDGNVTVTVIGELTVAEASLTLVGAHATAVTQVYVGYGSVDGVLNIGRAATVQAAAATSVVTVPQTSTTVYTVLTVLGSTTDASIVNVVDGKLIVAGDKDQMYNTNDVSAAVFTTDGTDGTYTDLTTALAEAKAKDTVALRQDAYVTKDTAVPAEVRLDLVGFVIFVGDADLKAANTPTFTISGTITSSVKADAVNAFEGAATGVVAYTGATVILNVSDTDVGPYFAGYALFGAAMTVSQGVTMTSTTAGIAVIMGTLNVDGRITSDVSLFSMAYAGKVNTAHVTCDAYAIQLNVAGELSLTGDADLAVNYTLTADIAGILNVAGRHDNRGTLAVIVEQGGKLVPTGELEIDNYNKFTMDVAGTVAYDKNAQFSIFSESSAVSTDITVAGILGVYDLYDYANSGSEVTDLTVTGSFTGADTGYDCVYVNLLTVSGDGSFAAAGSLGANEASVADRAVLTAGEHSWFGKLTVTGTATVGNYVAPAVSGTTGADASVNIEVDVLSVGTPAAQFADSANGATVTVVLENYESYGSGAMVYGYGIVYGTAPNVKVTAVNWPPYGDAEEADLASTALYLVGANENYLYATEYAVGTAAGASDAPLSLGVPAIAGYRFDGWFDAAAGGNTVTSGKVGDYGSIYGLFTPKTYNLNLGYNAGVIYYLNQAQTSSGDHQFTYGDSLTVAIVAADGYDISHATVTVKDADGNVVTDLSHAAQDLYVTVDGVTEKTAGNDGGLTLTDTLLIVLVIITAVVAIAVVFKLARS